MKQENAVDADEEKQEEEMPTMSAFILKSGNGYVLNDGKQIEMAGNMQDPVAASLAAKRFTKEQADGVLKRMEAQGLEAEIIELRIGQPPTEGGDDVCSTEAEVL